MFAASLSTLAPLRRLPRHRAFGELCRVRLAKAGQFALPQSAFICGWAFFFVSIRGSNLLSYLCRFAFIRGPFLTDFGIHEAILVL